MDPHRTPRGILTVGELIKILQGYPEQAPIAVSYTGPNNAGQHVSPEHITVEENMWFNPNGPPGIFNDWRVVCIGRRQ